MKRIRQPFTLKTMRDGCRMGGESIPIDICGFECRADDSSSIRFGQTYIPNRMIIDDTQSGAPGFVLPTCPTITDAVRPVNNEIRVAAAKALERLGGP